MKQARGQVRRYGRVWRLIFRRPLYRSIRLGGVGELPTKAAARRAADRWISKAEPTELHAGQVVAWSDWCDRYLDLYVPLLASGTQATQASIIETHLRTAFDCAVHEINASRAQEFVHAQRKAGVAHATIRARFNLLRRMLRQAVAEGLAASPPQASQVKFPKDESMHAAVRQKAFTPEECVRIIEGCTSIPERTAYGLALYAGLRTGEVLGLTWADVDLQGGALTIRQQAIDGELRPLKTKGSAAVLQAPSVLLELLREYRAHVSPMAEPEPHRPLFEDERGKPWTARALRERLHVLLSHLGIRRRGMHAFRHACALAMAAAGCSPEVIRRAMRHSSISVTAVYLSAAPEDVAAGLERGSVIQQRGKT